jgi:hypothetical protein
VRSALLSVGNVLVEMSRFTKLDSWVELTLEVRLFNVLRDIPDMCLVAVLVFSTVLAESSQH